MYSANGNDSVVDRVLELVMNGLPVTSVGTGAHIEMNTSWADQRSNELCKRSFRWRG